MQTRENRDAALCWRLRKGCVMSRPGMSLSRHYAKARAIVACGIAERVADQDTNREREGAYSTQDALFG